MEISFSHGGHDYQIRKLDATKQFHIARRLAPVLGELAAAQGKQEAAVQGMANALAKMSDAEADYVLHGLLAAVARKQAQGLGFAQVTTGSALMFQDLDVMDMVQLATSAFKHNFSNFFSALGSTLEGANLKQKGK